ncbi:MAG: beta-lactamase family protein [Saprospiraceae bacterium]|nr:beta-lactamase family protein [Saprospiraceae bacterium]
MCKCQLKDEQKISYQSLANHTSGLPRLPSNLRLGEVDPTNPYRTYGESQLLSYLKDELQLASTEKPQYAYSNLGAGLLGYCLTQVTNQSFEGLLNTFIFQPYEMTNSTSIRATLTEHLVPGRDASGKVTSNWDMSALVGAGGIISSVSDLVKFAQAQFGNNVPALQLSQTPSFTVNKKLKLGLGWHISKGDSKQDLHWHNGGTGGYSSCMVLDLEQQTAAIILTNVSAFHPKRGKIDQLCFELLENLRRK